MDFLSVFLVAVLSLLNTATMVFFHQWRRCVIWNTPVTTVITTPAASSRYSPQSVQTQVFTASLILVTCSKNAFITKAPFDKTDRSQKRAVCKNQKINKYFSLSFCLRVSLYACPFGTQLNGILQSSIPLQSSCKDRLDILL